MRIVNGETRNKSTDDILRKIHSSHVGVKKTESQIVIDFEDYICSQVWENVRSKVVYNYL